MVSLKPAAKLMVPPKPVSHVTPTTSGSEVVYILDQQEEDHYMPLDIIMPGPQGKVG